MRAGSGCARCPGHRAKIATGQSMDIIETIKEQIESNSILLYMKGSPNQPQCGFSARTVQALMACGERFAYVDILANPEIRTSLPKYANWPTFPQLWVGGELIGGCDIVTEMFESGELQTLIKETAATQAAG
jgi:monothiol glutaredoxin